MSTPRQGIHRARLPRPLPDLAAADVLGTVLVAGLLATLTDRDPGRVLVALLLLGLVVHWALGIRTALSEHIVRLLT